MSDPKEAARDQRSASQIVLNEIYWKPRSALWLVAQWAALALLLAENIFVPAKQDVNNLPYRALFGALLFLSVGLFALSRLSPRLRAKLYHQSQLYLVIALALVVWDIVTEKLNLLPLPFFPSAAQVIQVFAEDYQTLLVSTGSSLRLLLIGFGLGTVVGLLSGILMGWYRQWGYWLFPVIKIMGVIPATAWIPITMMIFPSSFYAQVFLIVLCVWFPVAYMTAGGIENVPKSYFEAARTLGADERFLVLKVAIPGAMPSIFTGVYTATGTSFATLVVSEMLGAKAGLGWYINWAKSWSNYDKVYASIIIMAIAFSVFMAIIFALRDRALIWQKGLLK